MPQLPVDTLITNTIAVTMNARREVITDAAIALRNGNIVDVGKTAELAEMYSAREQIDGQRFVATPGLVNSHIHLTGEPLARGYVPEDLAFDDLIFNWLCPLYAMY